MVQTDSNMETLTQRKTNFSIAAIMSGIAANSSTSVKEEPVDHESESPDTSIDTKTSDESSDQLPGLDSVTEKTVVKKEKKSKINEECHSEDLASVTCNLDNKDLWDKFCEFGTEMIITRTGRRMFPTVRCSFNNVDKMIATGSLSSAAKFHVLLDIVPADNKRYRYAYHRSQWLVAGKADPAPPHRLYPHPDGPFSLDQLRKQVTSFEKVKITNNESDNSGQVNILH